jgi:peptide/nickel transport system ATP-binding protein
VTGEPLLALTSLSVTFTTADGPVPAVRDVSLSLGAGECLALVGESGSGKSVTARSLLGLVGGSANVAAEQLSFEGRDLRALTEQQWRAVRGRRIGFVLQDALNSLDPLRRIADEVSEPLLVHGLAASGELDGRVHELLADAGIPDPQMRARQYPHELSGGLRQRALIASALACGPALLIADEPTTALDVTTQAQVLDLLAAKLVGGTALLLVSHDLAVVASLADRIAVMRAGEIVELGSAEQILTAPKHPYTVALLDAIPRLDRPALPVRTQQPAAIRLAVDHVSKRFRLPDGSWQQAVSDVSFELAAGESLGLVGESGSGKSTTALITLGLLSPDQGEVRLDGRPWASLPERRRRPTRPKIQFVQQDPLGSFDPRFTVERIIGEALGANGNRAVARLRSRIGDLLETVELPRSLLQRRPAQLSGGQRQRVAIARALAPQPEVIVCDEPVSALDVTVQAQILALLTRLRHERNVSILFISHDLRVIHEVCERVAVMNGGEIVETGPVAEVFGSPRHEYTRALLRALPQITALSNLNIERQIHVNTH